MVETSKPQNAYTLREAMRRFDARNKSNESRLDALACLARYIADALADNARQAGLFMPLRSTVFGDLSFGIDAFVADQNLHEVLSPDESDVLMARVVKLLGTSGFREFAVLLQDTLVTAKYTNKVVVVCDTTADCTPAAIRFV